MSAPESRTPFVHRLLEVAPPPPGHVVWIQRDPDEPSGFPPDYDAFLDFYGPGTFGHDLRILSPNAPTEAFSIEATTERVAQRINGKWRGFAFPVRPRPNALLTWSYLTGGDEWTFSWTGPRFPSLECPCVAVALRTGAICRLEGAFAYSLMRLLEDSYRSFGIKVGGAEPYPFTPLVGGAP